MPITINGGYSRGFETGFGVSVTELLFILLKHTTCVLGCQRKRQAVDRNSSSTFSGGIFDTAKTFGRHNWVKTASDFVLLLEKRIDRLYS